MRNVCETAFIRAATTTANSMQWNKKKVWKRNFVQQHCARASAVNVGGEVTPRTRLACLVACAKNQFATKAEKKYSTLFDVNACMPGIFPSFIGLENMQWQWLISTYSLRYFIFILLAYSCMMVVLHFVLRPRARWQFVQFRSCFVWNYCYSYHNYKLIISP